MRKALLVVFLLLSLFLLSSCATILSSSTTPVHFDTVPSGASVYVDGLYRGKTPLSLRLRNENHTASLVLEGYRTTHVRMERRLSLWYQLCDLVFFPFYGNAVDYLTYDGWRIAPTRFRLELLKE